MKPIFAVALAGAFTLASTMPALASSMPKVDMGGRPILGFGLGQGASLSLDFPLSSDFSLGGSLSLPNFQPGNLDVRGIYEILHGVNGGFRLGILGGVQTGGNRLSAITGVEPFVGLALSYPLTSQLTIRGNVAVGLLNQNQLRPNGIELGYKFTPMIEGTVGANGRGDFLGLKFSL